jgi:O-antigen ligase
MIVFFVLALVLTVTPLCLGGTAWWILYPVEILLFSTLAFKWKEVVREYRNDPPPAAFRWAVRGLTALVVISGVVAFSPGAALERVLYLLALTACFFLGFSPAMTPKRFHALEILLIVSGTLQVAVAFLQKAGLLSIAHWHTNEFIAGTFTNHNHFAGFLEITFPVTLFLGFASRDRKNIFVNAAIAICLVIQGTGLVASQSRGAWIAMAAAFVFAAGHRFVRKHLAVVFLAVLGLGLLVTVPVFSNTGIPKRLLSILNVEKDVSAHTRIQIWRGTVGMIRDNPLFGVGPGNFPVAFPLYRTPGLHAFVNRAHNDYLEWTAETGLFALPLLAVLLCVIMDRSSRGFSNHNPLFMAAFTSFLATVVHSLVDYNLRIPALGFSLAVLCAAVFRLEGEETSP